METTRDCNGNPINYTDPTGHKALNRTKAVNYALKHAKNPNPNYPNYAKGFKFADCANFVSQALHAGGKKMTGSSVSNNNAWFSRWKKGDGWGFTTSVSYSWREVKAFKRYWELRAKKVTKVKKNLSYAKFQKQIKKSKLTLGDVVQLTNKKYEPFHTTIITKQLNGNFYYTARTANVINVDLWKDYKNDKETLLIYHMK